jgi:hypothetical protein
MHFGRVKPMEESVIRATSYIENFSSRQVTVPFLSRVTLL